MKILNASYQIYDIPEPDNRIGVLQHIERIGRVCYKSEDKIDEISCIKFIENLKKRKHWAMLEHYIFTFSVPAYIYNDIFSIHRMTIENADLISKMPFINGSIWNGNGANPDYKYMISASPTALNYIWECDAYKNKFTPGIVALCQYMNNKFPQLMKDPMDGRLEVFGANTDGIRFISRDEMKSMPANIKKIHDFRSIKFTTNRAICMEFVRHRPASYAMESTRYCNYANGKFNNEISVIKPPFYDTNMKLAHEWESSMVEAESHYNKMIEAGCQPQLAREVLPQSTKADLVMTCRLSELHHFLDMRTGSGAHPQAREIAKPLLCDMINTEPEIFMDLSNNLED